MLLNVVEMLESSIDPLPDTESPYYELTQYFHYHDEPIIKLTYEDIEAIIGVKLCSETHLFRAFWYDDMPFQNH